MCPSPVDPLPTCHPRDEPVKNYVTFVQILVFFFLAQDLSPIIVLQNSFDLILTGLPALLTRMRSVFGLWAVL